MFDLEADLSSDEADDSVGCYDEHGDGGDDAAADGCAEAPQRAEI